MSTPWYTASWYRPATLAFGIIFLLAFAADSILLRDNDFEWHRETGKLFLKSNDASLYGDPYPLTRRMLDASLALAPYRASRAIVFSLAVICLWWTIRRITEMADHQQHLDRKTAFAAAAMALSQFIPFLLRDFQECGLHIILLAILTAGAYAIWSGRSIAAGFWFALAVTYKTSPVLFLPVLVWKRQWRAAGAMIVFGVILSLLPAFYLGWDLTVRCHLKSLEFYRSVGQLEDIAENGMEPPKPQNQALIAAFARYLQSYPPGHPLFIEHPAFVQYGNLDRSTSKLVAKGCLLALAVFVAVCMRGRWSKQSPDVLPQWAALCIFTVLYSPVCWRQHLVLAWPALFLLIRVVLNNPDASRWGRYLLFGSIVVLWIPQQELFGSTVFGLMLAAKPDTFIFLSWAMVLVIRPGCIQRSAIASVPELKTPLALPLAA